jgi:hypothetical protein
MNRSIVLCLLALGVAKQFGTGTAYANPEKCSERGFASIIDVKGQFVGSAFSVELEETFDGDTLVTCLWRKVILKETMQCLSVVKQRHDDMASFNPDAQSQKVRAGLYLLIRSAKSTLDVRYKVRNGVIDSDSLEIMTPLEELSAPQEPTLQYLRAEVRAMEQYLPQVCGWMDLSDEEFTRALREAGWS